TNSGQKAPPPGARRRVPALPPDGPACREEVQYDGQRQQRPWHTAGKHPYRVSLTVKEGKVASRPGNGGSFMQDTRICDLDAFSAGKPEPKPKINVLEIAEKILGKARQSPKYVAPVKCCGSTSREDIAI